MKKAFEITIVSFIMTGLALISTFPLVKNFTRGIPWSAFRSDIPWTLFNHPGDHLQLYYFFWLVKQNLLGLVPFNANPYEFNMVGGQTAGNDGFTTAPLAFISFLFSPLGDIVAYNCTVITSYILAGVFMYLLARIITDSKTGALLAAVMLTFIPIRINGLAGGNQYAFVLFFYPMIFYFMEKCIRTEKIRYSILAGLGIIALSFNEPHLIYYFSLSMVGYLPIRFISLIPVKTATVFSTPSFNLRKIMSWPSWLSLLVIWGGGAAVVLYAHLILPQRGHEIFFSSAFWWMIGYYPLIALFLSIMLASVYRHLSDKISSRQSLVIEAGSMLPLYLFPIAVLVLDDQKPDGTMAIIFAVSAVIAVKIWLLKPHVSGMAAHIWTHTKAMKRLLVVFSPALFGMIGTVVLTLIRKTKAIAPSTESGGRTLHDIKLYSAHFQDLFNPTSSVYIGLLPIGFGVIFLCYLLYRAAVNSKKSQQPDPDLPVYALLAVILLLSHALAMGLALGNRSLYLLFYHYVPFFNVPRVSERILCITILVLACVTAGVANAIMHHFRAKIWTIGCSIIFLMLTVLQLKVYSINTPMAVTDLSRQAEDGYQYIKDNIGDGILLELPLWPGDSHQSSIYEYYITLDEMKRINGYTPLVSRKYIDTVFAPLHSLDRGNLDQNQYNLLRRLNVKYITVHEHPDIFPPKVSPYPPATTVRRLVNSPYLEYLGPKSIMNKRYNKIHEQLYIFRVKEDVFSDDQATYYPMPAIYRPGSRLLQQTGTIIFDKTIGRKVYNAVPGRDKPGFLIYGPYSGFFPGTYRCYFRLKYNGSSNGTTGARIEAVRFSRGNQDILAMTELTEATPDDTYGDYYLDFEITKWEQLEFRVYYFGIGEISVDKVVVNSRKNNRNPDFLEAEMMAGETGRIVPIETASGQKVIEASPGIDNPGKVVYGPDLKYDAGHYAAIFYLKKPGPGAVTPASKTAAADAAIISITDHQEGTVFARQRVKSSSLQYDSFKGIRLEFTLSVPEEINFSVQFTSKVPIQLDGIEITKLSDTK